MADWGCALNLVNANSRTAVIGRAVTEHFYRRAVRRVCRIVEDAGGTFSGLVALTAQAKARSVLTDESDSLAVIGYHSVIAARHWEGPADEALGRAVRHVARAMGTLLEDHAVRLSLQLLTEIAATGHPEALPPAVAENVKARLG